MATPNPYDLEQDAFVRQMGGNNTTMGGAKGAKDTSAYAAVNPPPVAGLGAETKPQGASGINYARPEAGSPYAGFDYNNDYNLDSSAKGSFFYGTGAGLGDDRWRNSATSADWFNQFGRPALEGRGYTVGEVDRDKAFVHTREDPGGTWIDWVQGIDGDNPQLAWQDQSYMGGQGGGAGANMAPPSDLMQAITAGGGLTGNDTLEKIQKELQALINGQPSNVSQDAFSQAMR
jgi:hypothetical protein